MEASEADGSPQTRELKESLDHQGLGRGPNEIKFKEKDRLVDLEDKPRPPPEVPSGTTADHATMYESPGINPSAKTERKRHRPSQATSRTKTVKPERRKKAEIRSDPRDHAITR